ncbi:MAG: helix-turn-helix transcriptional regulator [Lentisphaerota bacterium]
MNPESFFNSFKELLFLIHSDCFGFRYSDFEFGLRAEPALGISYPHFRRIFRQYTGTSPVNYLIKCRLHNAAWLLLHSGDQISEIAEKCGIPDEFYFSRLFKKYYNLPPKTYRKEFQLLP